MAEIAILMNKNRPVLEIQIEKNVILSTGKVKEEKLLPIPLQSELQKKGKISPKMATDWFRRRLIPDTRENIEQMRRLFRGFENERYFFSLSDQYWIRYSNRDTWNKYNFFTNIYNKEVGKISFEYWNVDPGKFSAPSPDRTTNGALIKRWIQDDSKRSFLIKKGSLRYRQEPLSEVMASMMLRKMNIIPYVEYSLYIDGLSFCSKCPNFVTEDTEFVPAIFVFNMEKREEGVSEYQHLINVCEHKRIKGAREFLDHMILADHILCNFDRHFGNFGFIRSAETGVITGFAPLFDMGSAYWGTTEQVKPIEKRYFKEQEEIVVANAARNGILKKCKADKSVLSILKQYPDINDNKKTAIIEMIDLIDREIEEKGGPEKDGKQGKSPLMDESRNVPGYDFSR